MSIRVFPLDFLGQGALLEPANRNLHDLAIEFCNRELTEQVDFSKLSKVWVGLRDGEVLGVSGYVLRPDIPLLRATDADVLRALGQRMNAFFADNGALGKEAFLYVGNERPEQRCPNWRAMLKEFGAKSARRVAIEVK